MNRQKIKAEAREILNQNIWLLFKPYLIFILISTVISYFFDITYYAENLKITINFISGILTYPLSIGIIAYILKTIRKEPLSIREIYKFYPKFIFVSGLFILISIFVSLWSLLFIIPGIIAALSYAMAPFVMADGEEDPLECIKNSKKLMNGYKLDYFIFLLSFLGWLLIFIFAFWYIIPYIGLSEALYYEELKKITKTD